MSQYMLHILELLWIPLQVISSLAFSWLPFYKAPRNFFLEEFIFKGATDYNAFYFIQNIFSILTIVFDNLVMCSYIQEMDTVKQKNTIKTSPQPHWRLDFFSLALERKTLFKILRFLPFSALHGCFFLISQYVYHVA